MSNKENVCSMRNGEIDCGKKADFIAIGLSAQFGVPLKSFVCKDCKDAWIKDHPDMMNEVIMEYNSFKVKFKRIR